jgi:hypothetical protein
MIPSPVKLAAISSAILAALEREGKLSVYKLFLATGIPTPAIRAALRRLTSVNGGVVSLPGPKGTVYCLTRHAPQPERVVKAPGPYAIAGKITIPGYRYGSTRLG